MRIKKIAPVTPANGNIKNSYGTSQTDTYSQSYLNNYIEDSGWNDLQLLNSVTSRGTNYTPQYRKIGKVVYIRGQVNIPSHNSGIIMATLPTGYRPSMEAKLFGVVTNNWIDTGGNLWVATDTTERTNQVLQCEFLVD